MKSITITRSGEPEQVDPNSIQIPDLWHFVMNMKDAAKEGKTKKRFAKLEFLPEQATVIADAILETWHTAHQLKKAIIEAPDNMSGAVIIRIDGGVADVVSKTGGIRVEFRDYDNGAAAGEGEYETDEDGERYQPYVR